MNLIKGAFIYLLLISSILTWSGGCINQPETLLSISTPDKLSISPTGRKISFHAVFKKGKKIWSDIYILDIRRLKAEKITNGHLNKTPVWSPDGKKVAFVSFTPSNTGIWIMNLDRMKKTQFTTHSFIGGMKSVDLSPAWCPDPQKNEIAFIRQIFTPEGDLNNNLFVKEVSNLQERRVVGSEELGDNILWWRWGWDEEGDYIFFIGKDKNIWKANTITGEKIKLTIDSNVRSLFKSSNQRLLYLTEEEKGRNLLWVMDINGVYKEKVGNDIRWPDWFPDGKRICYTGKEGIGIMNLEDKKKINLGIHGSFPQVLPNGKQIIFLRNKSTELWMMNIDGTNQRKIFPLQD
jgi:TolB protein